MTEQKDHTDTIKNDTAPITAAVLAVGDELLSGRTKDKNIGYIADFLTNLGIDLKEARIVSDDTPAIIAAINALRQSYTYVFVTGGIGPTHDDVTADAVAAAFGVAIDEDPRAIALMLERYKLEDLNEARRRMARIPYGASLIENAVSKAPGFMLDNVIVMAGVPQVMQVMLDAVAPKLQTGQKPVSETIDAGRLPEGLYAAQLGEIAIANPGVMIGSYPSFQEGGFANKIVVRGKHAGRVADAANAVQAMLARLAG